MRVCDVAQPESDLYNLEDVPWLEEVSYITRENAAFKLSSEVSLPGMEMPFPELHAPGGAPP